MIRKNHFLEGDLQRSVIQITFQQMIRIIFFTIPTHPDFNRFATKTNESHFYMASCRPHVTRCRLFYMPREHYAHFTRTKKASAA